MTTLASPLATHHAAPRTPPAQSFRLLSGVLTSVGLAIAIVMAITFGWLGLFVSVVSLTLPFCLLWLSADVVRV